MNLFERRELTFLNERLRASQEDNARLRRVARINQAVTIGCVVAIGILLAIKYYWGEIWTLMHKFF